jgi:Na+-transporting NADH:ubiquinone oxidoreductase subunit A
MHNRILIDKVISIAGPGVLSHHVGYFKLREGYPIEALISGRVSKGSQRFISGDPLIGHKVSSEGFLGFYDDVFCIIPENTQREFLHFFSLGTDKYTHSWAYMSGHAGIKDREYDFNTGLHGEHRAFIDGSVYDSVMPLDVPVMLLTKAVMAEDFELAEQYGLLEVDSEDFALPTFVCPSKIEISEIIKKGLKDYSKEFLQ